VLLFGASNLTLGWQPLIRQIQQQFHGSLDLHICAGMGRSFLKPTRCGWRSLPSILDCQLWNRLPKSPLAARVLLTDIGNDIVYGFQPQQIVAAVQTCLKRLLTWQPEARFVITLPPLATLKNLGPVRFQIARRLLFPGCPFNFNHVMPLAEELASRLQELADDARIPLLSPPAHWYGFDPIHLRRTVREQAFQQMLQILQPPPGNASAPAQPPSAMLLPRPRPAERRIFRRTQLTPQPVFQHDRLQVSAW
jgi:hypothetical protein